MGQKIIPDGWFDPAEKIGVNAKCPCLSGKKYKNCHQESVKKAMRIIKAHQIIVNKKLVDIAGKKRLVQNGKNGWQYQVRVEGSVKTYSFDGRDYLKIDYHGLPMVFDNIFDADKIANAEVDEITYDECLIIQTKEEIHEEKTDL